MFEGFADEMVDLGDVRLRVRFAGDGPPITPDSRASADLGYLASASLRS